MPPRKRATKPERAASTAAVFRDSQHGNAEQVEKNTSEEDPQEQIPIPTSNELSAEEEGGHSFVVRIVYGIQDFLNDQLDFAKFVQLVILAFICHVFYLNNSSYVLTNMYKIGFNAVGVGMAFVFSYRSRVKLNMSKPTVFPMPQLPDFNLIYAAYIPTALAALYKSDNLHLNLCLNYFIVDYIHPLIRTLSAAAFFFIYREDNDPSSNQQILAIFLFHTLVQYLLNYFNEGSERTSVKLPDEVFEQDDSKELYQSTTKPIDVGTKTSLSLAEIQLFAVLLTNIVHYTALNDQYNLPLIIFQKLTISLVCSIGLLYPLLALYTQSRNFLLGVVVVAVSGGMFVYLTNYQLASTLATPNALEWLWNYITDFPERMSILVTWASVLAVLIPIVFILAPYMSLNLRRKVWHWVILGLITYPAYIDQPQFTILALLGSAVIFVVVEIVRYSRFTFIGQWFSDTLIVFQDYKDLKGPINVSYIYLIAGVTLPMVFDYCIDKTVSIKSFIGLVSLGVGDSSASIIGKRFGSVKWKGGPKSVQGTVAFVAITFVGLFLVDRFALNEAVSDWEPVFVSCLIGGILEGVSTLNDNLVIPCLMMIAFHALPSK